MSTHPDVQIDYRYPGYFRWFPITFNVAALFWPLFLCGISISATTKPAAASFNHGWVELLGAGLGIVFQVGVLVLTANYFPEVSADMAGLWVTFWFFRLRVRWDDIIDVRPSIFGWGARRTTWVVRTRGLTPFHRLYGLLYALRPEPSFIVPPVLNHQPDLLNRLRQRSFDIGSRGIQQ
jgi:hypothetical protein